jgi:hypothetical protein
LTRPFVVSAEIVARPFVVSAEMLEVGVRPNPDFELLPCEHTAAWDEHFRAKRKYLEALDASYNAEMLVVRHTRMVTQKCNLSAEHASETAHNVRRSLARSYVGQIGISKICEV